MDDRWQPTHSDITDEFILISPLLNATFRALYESKVDIHGRATFFAQLLDATAFLHRHGIWHRDIKPDNILVKSYDPPEAMLTDFGCATDQETIVYDWPGTVPYLAPEQVERETHGLSVDYWACGIIGLELIVGQAIKSRILPGPALIEHQEVLEKSKSVFAPLARAMLEEHPDARMSAATALGSLEISLRELRCGKRKRSMSADSVQE